MKNASQPGRFSAALFLTVLVALQGACAGTPEPDQLLAVSRPDCSADRGPRLTLGCAYSANLAAMVANPTDLKEGHALTPASGAREARAVDAYNKGQIKGVAASPSAIESAPTAGTGAQ